MAFAGNLIWRASSDLLQTWDSSTGRFQQITSADPRLPASIKPPGYRHTFGALTLLPDGRILVNEDWAGGASLQQGWTVDTAFDPDGGAWSIPVYDGSWPPPWQTFTQSEEGDGCVDLVEQVIWLPHTIAGQTPYAFNAYNGDGTWVRGVGDASTSSAGDAFVGMNSGYGACTGMIGRTLYRGLDAADGLQRYNLDTDTWEVIMPEWATNRAYGFVSTFAGVDSTEGLLVGVRHHRWDDPDREDHNGWIEVRDPEAQSWASPVPDWDWDGSLGPPMRLFNPAPPDGSQMQTDGWGGRVIALDGGYAYYSSTYDSYVDFGWDDANRAWGKCAAIWAMSLVDGSIEKVVDIPFEYYFEDGSVVTGDSADGFINNQGSVALGLLVIRAPTISGAPTDTRRRFRRNH